MEYQNITFRINGKEVHAEKGSSILEVARMAGIWIPTLCHHDAFDPQGSCRLCLVEVEKRGRKSLVTSCAYPVSEDIDVYTDTENVVENRKIVAELLLARCNENEQVKELCQKMGVSDTPFEKQGKDCMLCGLCVKMCNEKMKVGAINFIDRGEKRIVGTPYGETSEVCISCGACEFICPTGAISARTAGGKDPIPQGKEFDENLSTRSNIDIAFPSAVPLLPSINHDNCIHFQIGNDACGICQSSCKADAIDFDQTDQESEIEVGAIILCPGLERYDPRVRQELGFGRWPNVVSSIQFERILSASGPYSGTVTRPGDGKHPERIAWIQCVGSRDNNNANPWCSSVCCMYATKQSIIAKEHDDSIEPTIFYIDLRAFGKDFDKYVDRAKNEYGVRYQRAMISAVREEPGTGNLILRYADELGVLKDETFDMVVLSIGFQPYKDAAEFAETFGIEINDHRFAKTSQFAPVETSQEGVFVTGIFQGPKDIPETVMQGSAVAGDVMALLAEARGSEVVSEALPPEKDVKGDEPRVGIFVCSCGINIAGTVDVTGVVDEVEHDPGVVHAENLLYACSQDSQEKIKELIKEKDLNRILVASCTPRTHTPLFQETIRDAGLNKYLFELADIREQCSWCHMGQNEAATKKAIEIVKMNLAKTKLLEPVDTDFVTVTPGAMVIGGGMAGMMAALSVADQGFKVHIVEKEDELGGLARNLYRTLDASDVQRFLKDTIARVESHPNITVYRPAEVKKTDGFVGNFKTELTNGSVFEHGAIIVAIGGVEYRPTEYMFGENERIITQRDLEKRIENEASPPEEHHVMIQCVGSREEPNNYCSRICCQDAVKNAIAIKKKSPGSQVTILYRDIRTYGLREDYYQKARDLGVMFVRFEPENKPEVEIRGDRIQIKTFDYMLNSPISLDANWLVLSTGLRPHPGSEKIGKAYKLTRNIDGFFLEAHPKLRPVDFPSEGVFMAGLAHAPKNLDETLSQSLAAAGRAGTLLSHKRLTVSGVISQQDPEVCARCLNCMRVCPFDSPYITEDGEVRLNEVMCMGCGICASICPARAFQVNTFKDEQIFAMIDQLAENI